MGEPSPKVLPIPGVDNDQIYENPSEQYVPHITGHVTSLWSNGEAKITYITDAGYAFANGETTKVVTVTELNQDVVVGEPSPKVLPVSGVDNDQIYENPSEQYVPHITGHVTSLWSNGEAKITYTTDAGYVFADGETTKVVTVTEINQNVVIALPANPLDLTLNQPTDTDQYAWSKITDHSLTTHKIGITATAKPGYEFKYGTGTLTSKTFTLTDVYQFSYADNFGNVKCYETQGATTDSIACTFTDGPKADLAGSSGTSAWNSDFANNTRTGQGTLAYTVNAEGTGYVGTVTY